jgi:hypothetical protein
VIKYNTEGTGPNYMVSRELSERTDVEAMCVRFRNTGSIRCIWVNMPVRRHDLFYFKVFDADLFEATKCARISLLEPKYIRCSDNPEWFLNEKEKKELMEILTSKSNTNHRITNWQFMLYSYQSQLEWAGYEDDIDISNLQIPDYMKLEV